jgi:YfiH family protein
MPFIERDHVRYFIFDSLKDMGLPHAIFTRRGGVSPAPWETLNVGGTVGDNMDHVLENRRRSFQALGRDFASIYDVWQVHGNQVVCADAPRPANMPHQKADIILTNNPQVTLFMRFADCVPILLYDPERHVVGIVHSGWKGTVCRAAASAVESMQENYGSHPENIRAAVGPSIAAHHYPVGEDVVEQIQQIFGSYTPAFLLDSDNEQKHLDLWGANRFILEQSGVGQIEIAGICTACNLEDWYSHRGEKGETGRFGALIALNSG